MYGFFVVIAHCANCFRDLTAGAFPIIPGFQPVYLLRSVLNPLLLPNL